MPRPANVTYEQVASIADTLAAAADARSVTRRAVEDRLASQGLTCSASTLQKHLNAWRESRPAGPVAPPPELPAPIAAALSAELRRVAEAAVAPVVQELSIARAEAATLAEAGARLESQISELEAQAVELQTARDKASGVADERAMSIAELERRLADREKEVREAMTRIAVAEAKIEALEKRETDAIARAVRAEAQLVESHNALRDAARANVKAAS
jgi:hypothetical protein